MVLTIFGLKPKLAKCSLSVQHNEPGGALAFGAMCAQYLHGKFHQQEQPA
jgi:hypothetical protein